MRPRSQVWKEKDEGKKWKGVFPLRKEYSDIEFVPLKPSSAEPTFDELAYVIFDQGFKNVDKVEKASTTRFVMGFLFKDSDQFYLCAKTIAPGPIPTFFDFDLSISVEGGEPVFLQEGVRVTANSFDDVPIKQGS